MINIDIAKKEFKEAQRIKKNGTLFKAGHRANFYSVKNNNTLYLYIEETREDADWRDNFDFILKQDPVNKAWYHRGFYINAQIVLKKLRTMDYETLVIYSYSQGSAVAQIVSDFIHVDRLVTFGCPNNVLFNRRLRITRSSHIHYVQGFDFVYYGIFWLRKYGNNIVKLPSRGNPFKDHDYWWLNK